jgi:hypothetical protein
LPPGANHDQRCRPAATTINAAPANTQQVRTTIAIVAPAPAPAVSGVLGGGEQARLRALLAATSLVGTAMLRYLIEVPPLVTLPVDDVVRLVAPTVTRYLTADAKELGLPEAQDMVPRASARQRTWFLARALVRGREFPCTALEDQSR